MAAVMKANRKAGQFFFSPASMEFWNSEIDGELYYNRYFITSETPDPDMPRRYTVRFARSDGKIRELGRFREHETRESARQAIEDHYQSQNIRGHVPDELFE